MNLPLRVQVSTPLPVPVADLPEAQHVVERIARHLGHPANEVYMEQQGNNLVMYFDYGDTQ